MAGSVSITALAAPGIDARIVGGVTPAAVAATTLSSTGVTTLKGSITNDAAAAGNIGEEISATVAVANTVSISTGTGKTITSISLTAGDWDVSCAVNFVLTGVTATLFNVGISAADNTLPTQPGGSGVGAEPLSIIPLLTTALSSTFSHGAGPVRVSVASTTTIYLVAQATFSLGTLTGYGTIRARRRR